MDSGSEVVVKLPYPTAGRHLKLLRGSSWALIVPDLGVPSSDIH